MEQIISLLIFLGFAFVVISPWLRRENLEFVPRKRFATQFLGLIGCWALISIISGFCEAMLGASDETDMVFIVVPLLAALAGGVFQWKFNCIVLGRIKDAGWRPWLYWVGLVLPIQIVLLFVPTRR